MPHGENHGARNVYCHECSLATGRSSLCWVTNESTLGRLLREARIHLAGCRTRDCGVCERDLQLLEANRDRVAGLVRSSHYSDAAVFEDIAHAVRRGDYWLAAKIASRLACNRYFTDGEKAAMVEGGLLG